MRFLKRLVLLAIVALAFMSCGKTVVVTSGDLQIEFDQNMYSKVNSLSPNTHAFTDVFQRSEYLETKNFTSDKFEVTDVTAVEFKTEAGSGTETIIEGCQIGEGVSLTKIVTLKTYDDLPNIVLYDVSYINTGEQDVLVKKWTNNNYQVIAEEGAPNFWAFQGSSSALREDWLKPVTPGYYQKNFMGMNQSDYGGGIPVTDLWRRDGGIAIGHTELVPKEVSLPVYFDKYSDYAGIDVNYEYKHSMELNVGDTLQTASTFVAIHKGDYYAALQLFSEYMQKQGVKYAKTEDAAFESIWCGWGYERKFTVEDIIQTLSKVKELGIQWAVIDDGFQIAEGDWRVDTKRFPGGSKDIKRMVDAIHDHGMKAKLWWAPMAADPGSKILKDKPETLLINETGAPQYITWWDSYYLSPASEATVDYTRETVKVFMKDWGFDGLKLDGQHMNAVPTDHNWEREIEYPEKSIEMLPDFFKMIYETAREIKPHAVIENCPCGTCMAYHNMPYTNQTVSSDPLSSWQIRHKGKTYKAIMPQAAYYGDHVELSDSATDFASSFGIGAVLGTKFTWPNDNPNQKESQLLTPEREEIWKKWFGLYHEKMLSKENYLGGLYDIGFDKPETHVIAKGETLYYAFYDENWEGEIEFRGLEAGKHYTAFDYFNNKEIGRISGDNPVLNCQFEKYLLLAVSANK